jgi:hypothetical protein
MRGSSSRQQRFDLRSQVRVFTASLVEKTLSLGSGFNLSSLQEDLICPGVPFASRIVRGEMLS